MNLLWITSRLAAISLMVTLSAFAEDGVFVGPYEPDHLVPLDAHPGDWHDRYMDALRPQIRLDATFFARMIVRPSFEGESCLRLHGADGESDISKAKKFFLTCHEADKSIWYAMPENSDDQKQGGVNVAVSSAPVSEAFAKRLQKIWDQMLARTHEPDRPSTMCDGVTFEFATPKHSGQTHTPMKRLSPTLFTELGYSLITYCKATPDKRPGLMKSIEEHATNLENYLKAHPVR